jgi:anti-sigma factor RsiW
MTCRELVELVTSYFDGALDEATRADFDAHLATCPDCTLYVEQMRSLLDAFRDWRATRRV